MNIFRQATSQGIDAIVQERTELRVWCALGQGRREGLGGLVKIPRGPFLSFVFLLKKLKCNRLCHSFHYFHFRIDMTETNAC